MSGLVDVLHRTLIQRQSELVAQLEPVHRKFIRMGHAGGGAYAGMRSRIKHKHIEEMRTAGYTQREAAESAHQCDEVAYLNADHDVFIEQMGTALASVGSAS
jgi:hypothetical protein